MSSNKHFKRWQLVSTVTYTVHKILVFFSHSHNSWNAGCHHSWDTSPRALRAPRSDSATAISHTLCLGSKESLCPLWIPRAHCDCSLEIPGSNSWEWSARQNMNCSTDLFVRQSKNRYTRHWLCQITTSVAFLAAPNFLDSVLSKTR